MGQRLNLEILRNGEPLANAYYHWSAYTSSSVDLTQAVLMEINKQKGEPDDVLKAVRLLEVTGARIAVDELESMKNHCPTEHFDVARSRNAGLIAVSFEGMASTRRWEEYRVSVHLDTEKVSFNVFFVEEKDEYLETYEETEDEYSFFPLFPYAYDRLSFDHFDAFASYIRLFLKQDIYNFQRKDGSVLSFIE